MAPNYGIERSLFKPNRAFARYCSPDAAFHGYCVPLEGEGKTNALNEMELV